MLFAAQQRTNFAHHRRRTSSSHDGALDPENVSACWGIFKICIITAQALLAKEVECEKICKMPQWTDVFHTFTQKTCCNQRGYFMPARCTRLGEAETHETPQWLRCSCQCVATLYAWCRLTFQFHLPKSSHLDFNLWKCVSRREFPA